jgi:2-oxo-4-hydroxy-4-carboxy-5-ureidoimidazoline decarboxylase
VTAPELSRLAEPAAREELRACCGAAAWVEGMLGTRPWPDAEALLTAADRVWEQLTHAQIAEAVRHHPRLGESHAGASLSARASGWSAGEQAGVAAAETATRAALAAGNVEYEQRFGHTFIACASGRSAGDLLSALRARLGNEPATELQITARELHKITRLRLAKRLADA